MQKLILYSCWIILLITSCGTRKREVDRSVKKMDLTTSEKFELSKISDNSTMVLEDEYKFTLLPVDPALPIIYRRDTIYNSKVIYQRVLRDSIVRIRDTVFIKQETETKDTSILKEKETKVESKRPNPWQWLSFALVAIFALILLFNKKR